MADNSSNTADNTPKVRGKPFVKGDKRINRKGRPKSFDALRALAQQIAIERAQGKDVTTIENILRDFARSRNWQEKNKFIEIAYGKVPDEIKQSGELKVVIEYDKSDDTAAPSGAETDQGGEKAV